MGFVVFSLDEGGSDKTGSARKRKWLKTNHPQRENQVEIKIKLSGK